MAGQQLSHTSAVLNFTNVGFCRPFTSQDPFIFEEYALPPFLCKDSQFYCLPLYIQNDFKMSLNVILRYGPRGFASSGLTALHSLPVWDSNSSSKTCLVSGHSPFVYRAPASCQIRSYINGTYIVPWPEYPVHLVEQLLYNVHQFTDLPWWGTIVGVALAMKLVTTPLGWIVSKTSAQAELLRPEIRIRLQAMHGRLIQECKAEKVSHMVYKKRLQKKAKEVSRSILKREKVNPYWGYIQLLQIPVWLTMSIALRDLSSMTMNPLYPGVAEDISVGGTLWFDNLLLPDPCFILPIVFTLFYLLNIELVNVMSPPMTTVSRLIRKFSRVFAIPLFMIAIYIPTSVVLYFAVITSTGFLQTWLLYLPSVRRLVRIPKSPKEQEHPVQFMLQTSHNNLKKFIEKQGQKKHHSGN